MFFVYVLRKRQLNQNSVYGRVVVKNVYQAQKLLLGGVLVEKIFE